MSDVTDMELLQDYARRGADDAFATVVQRQVNLVYSAAFRHTGVAAHAEEITQAVFVILAQKAAALRPDTILEAWLCETTRLTSLRFLRGERRRQRREQEAGMQSTLNEPNDPALWTQLAPLLDDALARLGRKDREAVVLRFFKDQSLGEVAAAMNVTEAAAQSRVHRAVEKLRKMFAQRGVVLTAAAIAGTVTANSVQAAPAGLAGAISAVAAAKGAAAGGSTLTLVKGALKVMAWTKVKTTVVVGAVLLLAAGTTTVAVKDGFFAAREPSYQGRSLVEWLPDVDYDQPQDVRAKAADAIRHMGAATLPFLLNDLMNDPRQPRHRVRYIKPDARTGDRGRQACWAFDALGPLGKPAIPELTRMLEQNPGCVTGALCGIGPDALPQILNSLTNGSFWVRDNMAASLANAIYAGKIAADDAAPALPVAINNLTYSDTNLLFTVNTRFRAVGLIDALKLEPEVSVPALAAELTDTNMTVVSQAAQAIGGFGAQGKAAVPALLMAVASTNAELSCCSAVSLSQIDTNAFLQSVPVFASLLTNSPNDSIPMRLVQALGRLGPRGYSVVPLLLPLLHEPDDIIRMVTTQTLGNLALRPEEVIPALRRGLHDSSPIVRMESATALGKFGAAARDSVPALIEAARNDPTMKGNVSYALSQIDPRAARNFK